MWAKYKHELLIVVLGSILFIPFLGNVHLFDWDEINFAEAAREMIVTHNYLQVQIDFQPFWEKPPLFFWMQVISMKIFGVNEFAARFPNAICGILTLLVIFRIGRKLKDIRFGWLWVICFAGSILPQMYFKSGIIDPWFNFFIFLSLHFFIRYLQNHFSIRQLFYSGLLIGIAVMIKGPASIAVLLLCFLVFFVISRFKLFLPFKHIFIYAGFVVLALLPWLVTELLLNGTWFLWEFTKYQFQLASTDVAGHSGFFGYHFVVVFFLCFPAAAFAIPSFVKSFDTDETFSFFRKWMLILFWVVLILFSIVQTKIIHYSSLTYLPLTFLAATTIYYFKEKWNGLMSAVLVFSSLLFTGSLLFLPYIVTHPDLAERWIQDPVLLRAFSSASSFSGDESVLGVIMLAGLILAIILNHRKKIGAALTVLFTVSIIIINIAILVFLPRIEFYSQQPMINFFEAHKNDDAYLSVYKFKSYAQLFYGERKESDIDNPRFINWLNKRRIDENETASWPDPDAYRNLFIWWMLTGDIDKPALFVVKTSSAEKIMKDMPHLIKTGAEGGYVFLRREPVAQ